MTIDFSCRKCETRFKVSDHLAGKKARCKKCGEKMRVPEAPDILASTAASGVFRLGSVSAEQVASATATATATATGSVPNRRRSVRSGLRLAPSVQDELDAATQEEEDDDEFQDDSFEYKLAKPLKAEALSAKKRSSGRRVIWGPGGIAEVVLVPLRKVSDFAFLASILFLLALLLAIVMKERELALLTVGIIILANIVRLVLEGIVLGALAFKNGPLEGVLFFIPPFTFHYIGKRGKVMKEAVHRFLVPAVPIVLVVLLFVFVPFLRGDTGLQAVPGGDQIQEKLRSLGDKIKTNVRSRQLSEDEDPPQNPEN